MENFDGSLNDTTQRPAGTDFAAPVDPPAVTDRLEDSARENFTSPPRAAAAPSFDSLLNSSVGLQGSAIPPPSVVNAPSPMSTEFEPMAAVSHHETFSPPHDQLPASSNGSAMYFNGASSPGSVEPSASSPVTSTTCLDALNRQIANRTAAMDEATREKEAQITAAAQQYLKEQQARWQQHVTAARAEHKKNQQDGENKISEYKKSGAVWNGVGVLLDLQKPNPYSKGTEQMRSILTTLGGQK